MGRGGGTRDREGFPHVMAPEESLGGHLRYSGLVLFGAKVCLYPDIVSSGWDDRRWTGGRRFTLS